MQHEMVDNLGLIISRNKMFYFFNVRPKLMLLTNLLFICILYGRGNINLRIYWPEIMKVFRIFSISIFFA